MDVVKKPFRPKFGARLLRGFYLNVVGYKEYGLMQTVFVDRRVLSERSGI